MPPQTFSLIPLHPSNHLTSQVLLRSTSNTAQKHPEKGVNPFPLRFHGYPSL